MTTTFDVAETTARISSESIDKVVESDSMVKQPKRFVLLRRQKTTTANPSSTTSTVEDGRCKGLLPGDNTSGHLGLSGENASAGLESASSVSSSEVCPSKTDDGCVASRDVTSILESSNGSSNNNNVESNSTPCELNEDGNSYLLNNNTSAWRNSTGAASARVDPGTKSLQEREQDYERAKRRIFGADYANNKAHSDEDDDRRSHSHHFRSSNHFYNINYSGPSVQAGYANCINNFNHNLHPKPSGCPDVFTPNGNSRSPYYFVPHSADCTPNPRNVDGFFPYYDFDYLHNGYGCFNNDLCGGPLMTPPDSGGHSIYRPGHMGAPLGFGLGQRYGTMGDVGDRFSAEGVEMAGGPYMTMHDWSMGIGDASMFGIPDNNNIVNPGSNNNPYVIGSMKFRRSFEDDRFNLLQRGSQGCPLEIIQNEKSQKERETPSQPVPLSVSSVSSTSKLLHSTPLPLPTSVPSRKSGPVNDHNIDVYTYNYDDKCANPEDSNTVSSHGNYASSANKNIPGNINMNRLAVAVHPSFADAVQFGSEGYLDAWPTLEAVGELSGPKTVVSNPCRKGKNRKVDLSTEDSKANATV